MLPGPCFPAGLQILRRDKEDLDARYDRAMLYADMEENRKAIEGLEQVGRIEAGMLGWARFMQWALAWCSWSECTVGGRLQWWVDTLRSILGTLPCRCKRRAPTTARCPRRCPACSTAPDRHRRRCRCCRHTSPTSRARQVWVGAWLTEGVQERRIR